MAEPHEIIVYIHGVSQELRGTSHRDSYETLHAGIAAKRNDWPDRYLGVEWGWNATSGPAKEHELLTDAQRMLGARALAQLQRSDDWSINPGRLILNNLRPLLIYGFGDMFYYVSTDGKRSVRNAIARQLCQFIDREADWDAPISLTLLGHSAGSVVAFDLCFFLFFQQERASTKRAQAKGGKKKPASGRSKRADKQAEHTFLAPEAPAYDDAKKIRRLADANLLRIRRLITFGSPITMLACRSDPVLEILARDKQLDPKDYGLSQDLPQSSGLQGPRWLNIWDRDDPIAWPVEPLMQVSQRNPAVADHYIDVSDSVSKSHTSYWDSDSVHETIARHW